MLVLIHVLSALASLAVAAVNLLIPSAYKLRATYVLTGLTVATGTWLIVSDKAHILTTCITGLIYLSAITVATVMGRFRLNKLNNS